MSRTEIAKIESFLACVHQFAISLGRRGVMGLHLGKLEFRTAKRTVYRGGASGEFKLQLVDALFQGCDFFRDRGKLLPDWKLIEKFQNV